MSDVSSKYLPVAKVGLCEYHANSQSEMTEMARFAYEIRNRQNERNSAANGS